MVVVNAANVENSKAVVTYPPNGYVLLMFHIGLESAYKGNRENAMSVSKHSMLTYRVNAPNTDGAIVPKACKVEHTFFNFFR
jgi:hypothetical protein